MIESLSIDRFLDLVAGYGADPDRWPAEQRGSAVGCLVESETARAAWRDAAGLDADLDSVPGLDMSPELVESVLAIADVGEKQYPGILTGAMRLALPYAAAAAIALVVGLSVPSPFRDAPGVTLQDEIAASETVIVDDTVDSGNGLTALALVDATVFADDETGEVFLGDDNPLSELPLL